MQALRYDIWQSNVAAAAEEQQQFVLKTGAPVTGTCGKTLADNEETISLTIDVTEADPENRCGITVVSIVTI